METYSVHILNPKATKLLQDMADLELIAIEPVRLVGNAVSDEEKARARERVRQGAPTLHVDEMLAWLQASKKDRELPFRDDE